MCVRKPLSAVLIVLTLAVASCSQDPNRLKRKYVASGDDYFAKGNYAEAIVQVPEMRSLAIRASVKRASSSRPLTKGTTIT